MRTTLSDAGPTLTPRQLQVVELIALGCSNEEVGRRLGISPRTAKAHCDALRSKLGVPRRRQIPAAFRTLTGQDPLARELAAAVAGAGGGRRPRPARLPRARTPFSRAAAAGPIPQTGESEAGGVGRRLAPGRQ